MKLEAEKLIRGYYKKARLWIPPSSNFTHYRFFLVDGAVVKIRDRITSVNRLRKALVRFAPLHAYFSSSLFLNPTTIGRRTDKISQNHFLGSNFILFDIDKNSLEEAKKEVKTLCPLLETRYGHKNLKILYSGSRGFHVFDFDFAVMPVEDPREWERKTLEQKKMMAQEVAELVDIDEVISWDTRRITRIPLTIHGGSGNLAEWVSMEKIDDFQPTKIVDLPELPKPRLLLEELKRLG